MLEGTDRGSGGVRTRSRAFILELLILAKIASNTKVKIFAHHFFMYQDKFIHDLSREGAPLCMKPVMNNGCTCQRVQRRAPSFPHPLRFFGGLTKHLRKGVLLVSYDIHSSDNNSRPWVFLLSLLSKRADTQRLNKQNQGNNIFGLRTAKNRMRHPRDTKKCGQKARGTEPARH